MSFEVVFTRTDGRETATTEHATAQAAQDWIDKNEARKRFGDPANYSYVINDVTADRAQRDSRKQQRLQDFRDLRDNLDLSAFTDPAQRAVIRKLVRLAVGR